MAPFFGSSSSTRGKKTNGTKRGKVSSEVDVLLGVNTALCQKLATQHFPFVERVRRHRRLPKNLCTCPVRLGAPRELLNRTRCWFVVDPLSASNNRARDNTFVGCVQNRHVRLLQHGAGRGRT